MTTIEAAPADGRRARRERGRLAVIDSMIDLVREGDGPPSTDAIAERAGVSVASLFRYFDGLEDLHRETAARFFHRYDTLFDVPELGAGTLTERVERYTAARIKLYENIAPFARFARANADQRDDLASSLVISRRRHADLVRRHFAAELDTRTRAEADDHVAVITALTSFESWDMLCRDLLRTKTQVRRAWAATITTLLQAR